MLFIYLIYLIVHTEHEIGFSHLDMNSVVKAYKTTKKRVLLLDLNGTIVFKEPPGKYLKRDVLGSSGMLVEKEVRSIYFTLEEKNTLSYLIFQF